MRSSRHWLSMGRYHLSCTVKRAVSTCTLMVFGQVYQSKAACCNKPTHIQVSLMTRCNKISHWEQRNPPDTHERMTMNNEEAKTMLIAFILRNIWKANLLSALEGHKIVVPMLFNCENICRYRVRKKRKEKKRKEKKRKEKKRKEKKRKEKKRKEKKRREEKRREEKKRKEKKRKEKKRKRKEKTTPFGVNLFIYLMRSQVLYRAAQAL